MRRSRLLLPALGLALLTACQGRSPEPGKEPPAGGPIRDALTAAEQLSTGGELAYVTAWHENEGLGIATVEYPFRSNTNEGTRLVDATGKRIDVDAVQLDDTLRAAPSLHALRKDPH